ncbi:GAF sensor-containing diguanylate cyclase [Candidatus Omnitrophus magneticus]|uniref:diguanylate cyclase n=1 Tax=Candidatus Omnitrophus magneticus TaxID=1609969 RepID=A0A0F0CVW7_9BACT|nr:GAF sensor-containing diguanylate cyclase [Candidatus Omnitrophus magneticus]
MRRLNKQIIIGINVLTAVLAFIFYFFMDGRGYIPLFILLSCQISLFFVFQVNIALFFMAWNILFLSALSAKQNITFIDMLFFSIAGILLSSAGYVIIYTADSFEKYFFSKLKTKENEYNRELAELNNIEKKGRVVEDHQARISRLYEITKKFGAVLKLTELTDKLFDFFEDNFQFSTFHFFLFNKGDFIKGISKTRRGAIEYHEGTKVLDYKAVIEYMREREFKPFYVDRKDAEEIFDTLGIRAKNFLAFPLFVKSLYAIIAIEGASKTDYNHFSIIIPQIALELRKVELYEQIEKLSIVDGLTNVYLRRYLNGRLNEEVDRAKRLGLTFSVVMIDIDHFKMCNDKYGHLVGDAVLKEVAERLKMSVREVDMIARYGGEEFCVLLPDTTKELAVTVAERLRRFVEFKIIKAFDAEIKITISAGVATYPNDGQDAVLLIESADTALYKAKRKGRNMVCAV